ncbi:hypothetical protein [Priestia megaterium]|nr:hypothetical protein [Priestia megaterium]
MMNDKPKATTMKKNAAVDSFSLLEALFVTLVVSLSSVMPKT